MPDLFISYSRRDDRFVRELHEKLNTKLRPDDTPIDCWIDFEDIEYSSVWWERIRKGIEESNNFTVILSKDYLSSEICNEELLYARQLGKPIIPIVVRASELSSYPDGIQQRIAGGDWTHNPIRLADENYAYIQKFNYIFLEKLGIDGVLEALITSVFEDLEYKDHSKNLLLQALQWRAKGDHSGYLLTGSTINEAETWRDNAVANGFPVEPLHLEFITKSRAVSRRRQQRLLSAALVALVVVAILSILALTLHNQSNERLNIANERATKEAVANVEALSQQSKLLADLSTQALNRREIQHSLGLALRSLENYPLIFNQGAYEALLNAISEPVNEIARIAHPMVEALQWSSDGSRIVSGGGDGKIRIIDGNSGRLIRTIEHGNNIYRVQWGLNDTVLYVWSEDTRKVVYSSQTGELIPDKQPPSDPILFTQSPDGRYNLVENDNQKILKNIETDESLLTIGRFDADEVGWDARSQRVVFISVDGEGLIFDIFTRAKIKFQTASRVFEITWNPDNTQFLTYSRNAVVQQWDAKTGQLIHEFKHNYVSQTAFDNSFSIAHWNGDGSRILTSTQSGDVAVWNAITGESLSKFKYPNYIKKADWTSDGKRIAIAVGDQVILIGNLKVETLSDVAYLEFPQERQIIGGTLSHDGQRLLTYGADETAHVWDLKTGKSLSVFSHPEDPMNWLRGAVWNHDETKILTWAPDSTVNIWDVATGDHAIYQSGQSFGPPMNMAQWSRDEQRVLGVDDYGNAYIWDVQSQGKLFEAVVGGEYSTVLLQAQWSHDEHYLLLCTLNDTRVYDVIANKEVFRYAYVSEEFASSASRSCHWDASEQFVTIQQDNQPTHTYDWKTHSEVTPIKPTETLALLPNSDASLSANWDNTGIINVFNGSVSTPVLSLHHPGVNAILWGPRPDWLFTCGNEHTYVWFLSKDLQSAQQIQLVGNPNVCDKQQSLIVTADSRYIITAGYDAKVRVQLVDVPHLIELGNRQLVQPLNNSELEIAHLVTAQPSLIPTATATATFTPTLDLTRVTATPFSTTTPVPTNPPTSTSVPALTGDNLMDWAHQLTKMGLLNLPQPIETDLEGLVISVEPHEVQWQFKQMAPKNSLIVGTFEWSVDAEDETCGLVMLTTSNGDQSGYIALNRNYGVWFSTLKESTWNSTPLINNPSLRIGRGETNTLAVAVGTQSALVFINKHFFGQFMIDDLPSTGFIGMMATGSEKTDKQLTCRLKSITTFVP